MTLIGDFLIFTLPLVTAVLVYALTAAGIYLSNKYRNNKLIQTLLVLNQLVMDVVKELNQSVVEDLKAARADGKLTVDEAKQIKDKAVDLILSRLDNDFIRVIQGSFGSIYQVISTKIEAAIFDLKH
ncbi:MAG TPA: hypothetical protein PLC07_04935 [Bacillota bacterium]|nr:hypothetical protein [Bacillota bacterium]HPT86868.1 hypothetical protein [Bacillota bacterium]